MRVIVAGAGWSGLCCATFLTAQGVDVVVVEADTRVGGRIRTTQDEGHLLEHGPHAVPLASPAVRALVDAAHIEMLPAPPRAPRFVVHNGDPSPLPTSPTALARTRLVPLRAKLRALAEPLRHRGGSQETLSSLVARRFHPAFVSLADAAATGIYAGDPARLLVEHAFPRLHAMDQRGGLLRGARNLAAQRLAAPHNGMQDWMERLAALLDVRTNEAVTAVRNEDARVFVETTRGAYEADHAVLSLDPAPLVRVLGIQAPQPPVAPVSVVGFGLPEEAAPREGYGMLASEDEGRFMLGALYESALFAHRAPEGMSLVRVLVGGRRHPERAHLPDDEMEMRAWNDLRELGVVRGEPSWSHVARTSGIPQPEIGHGAWLAALPAEDRVHPLGIGTCGVGLAALADSAAALAARLR